jgi:hypothetical protein
VRTGEPGDERAERRAVDAQRRAEVDDDHDRGVRRLHAAQRRAGPLLVARVAARDVRAQGGMWWARGEQHRRNDVIVAVRAPARHPRRARK